MSLFSSLRARPASSDEKEHDSDSNNDEDAAAAATTALLPPSSSSSPSSASRHRPTSRLDAADAAAPCFPLRIKLNDGTTTADLTLAHVPPDAPVRTLKARILAAHDAAAGSAAGPAAGPARRGGGPERYLRLIVRGRMLAPDAASLDSFAVAANDVIHAVLAKEGARGGQQARMLRRLNGTRPDRRRGTGAGRGAAAGGGDLALWRRIGVDANGVVVPPADADGPDSDETDDEEEAEAEAEEDFADAHGELDLEAGRRDPGGAAEAGQGAGRRRRRRERRGFDRLRSTGMTRDEVTAIRLYFARSVDRYVERRRVLLRAARRPRARPGDGGAAAGAAGPDGPARGRADTGGSSNSLLEEGAAPEGAAARAAEGGADGRAAAAHDAEGFFEEEEILLDRRRMEDEWMSTQGPYSEFRMNLNTSNPLLLAAITGGDARAPPEALTPAGLFLRARRAAGGPDDDDDDDLPFDAAGAAAFLPAPPPPGAGAMGGFPPYGGPVPAAGTDKDFVWGFTLGFFVGFVMLFWVWMPTVPHKQKIGIMAGISFQLLLGLWRKEGEEGGVAAF